MRGKEQNIMHKKLPFFFLILLSINLITASTQTPTQTISTLRSIPWELTVIAAILFSLTLIGLGYMLSKSFGVKELGAWANNELYQIIMISFLVFLIFSIIKIESIVFEAYGLYTPDSTGSTNPAIENSKHYLFSVRSYLTFLIGGTLLEKGAIGVSSLVLENAGGKIKQFIIGLLPLSLNPSGATSVFLSAISSIIDMALNSFGTVYALNSMQIYFLDFIDNVAFTFLLPLGIFLRIFSFTKRAGSLFIVLAISLYIVLPLTYLLNQQIVDTILNKGQNIPANQNIPAKYSWENILNARISNFETLGDGSFINNKLSDTNSSNLGALKTIFMFIFVILSEGAFAFVLFTLIPIIDFTITVVITKELGSLFGGDLSLNDIIKFL